MNKPKDPVEQPEPFKRTPRRKKEPVTRVAVSADAKARYEQLVQERDQQQRLYKGFLPPDRGK